MGCALASERVSQQKTMMMESTYNKEQREKEQRMKAHLILDEYRQTKTVRKQVKLQSDVKDALSEQLLRNNKTITAQKS